MAQHLDADQGDKPALLTTARKILVFDINAVQPSPSRSIDITSSSRRACRRAFDKAERALIRRHYKVIGLRLI